MGHSDGDALLHAVCDAILGAIGEGDVGRHFPDSDQNYKDILSLILLQAVARLVDKKAFMLHNVDCTIVLERPKLMDYKSAMAANIAAILCLSQEMVNIKAKTSEGLGLVGVGEGVAAFAVVLS